MKRLLAYNKKFLVRLLVWLGFAFIVMKATGGGAGLVIPVVALSFMYSVNKVNLFFIFLLMISMQVVNGYFVPKSAMLMLSIRATLLLLALMMSARLFGRRVSPLMKPFSGLALYLLWEFAISGQGFAPLVSYLKLILFSLIYLAYYAIANEVVLHKRVDTRKIRSVVLSFAVLFIIGSVLVIPFPGISLMQYGEVENAVYIESLFKGMTTHSQSMGPLVAAINALILGDLLFSVKKVDKLYLIILICCPILIWKSGSRTALGTYLASSMLLLFLFMQARGVGQRWKGKIMSAAWGIGILGLVMVVAVPSMREKFLRFAVKASGDVSESRVEANFENITASRQGAMDACMANFRKKPLMGNGFQVSDAMEDDHRRGFWAYLSAPIEKGVWVTAILEEGGIIGLLFFTGFLACTFLTLYKHHAYITVGCLFSMMLSNMGEFTIFSMTYTGGFIWALVFAGVIMDAQRLKDQRLFVEWMMGLEQEQMRMQPMMGRGLR